MFKYSDLTIRQKFKFKLLNPGLVINLITDHLSNNHLDRGKIVVKSITSVDRYNNKIKLENVVLNYRIVWRDSAFSDNEKIQIFDDNQFVFVTVNSDLLLNSQINNIEIDAQQLATIKQQYDYLKKCSVFQLGKLDDNQVRKNVGLQFKVVDNLNIQIPFLKRLS